MKTEIYGTKYKKFHVRSESCPFGVDTPKEVQRILSRECARGFDPIGIILTPSGTGGGYTVTLFLKVLCPKTDGPEKPCPYCVTEASNTK